jgi:hypothetical protein
LTLHQQQEDQLRGDLLGGAAEEGLEGEECLAAIREWLHAKTLTNELAIQIFDTIREISLATMFRRYGIAAAAAAVGLTAYCHPASAQFAGAYAPSTWTTTNFNSDGSVNTSGTPNSITITGPDSGNDNSYTQFSNQAKQRGIYKFKWSYSTNDGATYDYPQFVINGNARLFQGFNNTTGSKSQNGNGLYTLNAGDAFAFRVFSTDGVEGAATVTIFDFLYPILYTSSAQPYANIQSISLDALKNQRELVLAQAGECAQNGWVIYDSEKVKGKAKPKKYQSLCVFGEGGYAQGDINGSETIGGYSTSNATTAYGIEWKPSKKWAVGAAYGYGTANLGNFNFQDTSAYINSDINSGNIYGVYRPSKNWKISALAGYSKYNSNGARTYFDGTATGTANSAFASNGYTGALEASYDIFLGTDLNNKRNNSNPVRIKPLVGIAWGGNQQSAFSETGEGTLLNIQEQMSNSLVATFGASLEAPIPLNKKKTTVLKPRFGIAYQYDFLANQDANKQITATLQDDSTTSFTEVGQNRGINNIYLNLGGDLQVNPKTVVYANVNYQAFSYGNQIGYQGGIRIKL